MFYFFAVGALHKSAVMFGAALLFSLVSFSTTVAAKCTNVRLSGPPIWPPYVNGEEKSKDRTGLAINLAEEIFSDLGISHEIDDAKPWARVISELEQGKIDIIFALLSSPERQEKFLFTESWLNDYYGVITYKGKEFEYESVEDLKSRRGVVYHGINLPEPLNQAQTEDYDLIELPEIPSLYKMLKLGRADYIIAAPLTFKKLLPEGYTWSEFSVLKPSVVHIPLFMAMSRKSPCTEILDQLNAEIREHGKHLQNESYSEIFPN